MAELYPNPTKESKPSVSLYPNPNRLSATGIKGFEYDDYSSLPDSYDPMSFGISGLQEERAQNQSRADKWGNALVKMGITAGTTFLDSTVGTIVGGVNAAAEGTFSGFYNNFFSNWMADLQENAEEALPNYYTRAEQERPWYENLVTANFWADKVLKNFGFMIGTVASSMLAGGAIRGAAGSKQLMQRVGKGLVGKQLKNGRVIKETDELLDLFKRGMISSDDLTKEIIKDGKALGNINFASQMGGAIIGSTGEARIEAIQSIRDYGEKRRREDPNLSEEELQKELIAVGNSVFSTNLAILSLGNTMQWGRHLGGNFKMQKNLFNQIDDFGKRIGTKGTLGTLESSLPTSKLGKAALGVGRTTKAIMKGPMWEGMEEQLQKVATESASQYYNDKEDPDATADMFNYMEAFTEKLGEQFESIDNWEEFFIGMISAGMGVPTIQNRRFKRIGGVDQEIREMYKEDKKKEELIKAGKAAYENGKTLYDAAIRDNKYQKKQQEALKNNDEFGFEDTENSQIVNDIITALELGRIDEYVENIAQYKNISIEEARNKFTNENGESLLKDWSDEEIQKNILDKADDVIQTANFIRENKINIDNKFPGLNEDVRNELLYIGAKGKSFDKISNKLAEELSKTKLVDGRELQQLLRDKAKYQGTEDYIKSTKGRIGAISKEIKKLKNKTVRDKLNNVLKYTATQIVELDKAGKLEVEIRSINETLNEIDQDLKELEVNPYSDRMEESMLNKHYTVLSQKIQNLKNKKQYYADKISKEINAQKKELLEKEADKLNYEINQAVDTLEEYREKLKNATERFQQIKIEENEKRKKVVEQAPQFDGLTYEEFTEKIKGILEKEKRLEELTKKIQDDYDTDQWYEFTPQNVDALKTLRSLELAETERLKHFQAFAKAYSHNEVNTLQKSIDKAKAAKERKKNIIQFNNTFKDGTIVRDSEDKKDYKVVELDGKKFLYEKDEEGNYKQKREFVYEEGVNERYKDVNDIEVKVKPTKKEETKKETPKKKETIQVRIEQGEKFPFDPNPKPLANKVNKKSTSHIGRWKDKILYLFNKKKQEFINTLALQKFIEKTNFDENPHYLVPVEKGFLFADVEAKNKELKEAGYNPESVIYVKIVDESGKELEENGKLVYTTLSTESPFTVARKSDGRTILKSEEVTKKDFFDTELGLPIPFLTKDKNGVFTFEKYNQLFEKEIKEGTVDELKWNNSYSDTFTDEVEVLRPKFAFNKGIKSAIGQAKKSGDEQKAFLNIAALPEKIPITGKTFGVPILEDESYSVKEFLDKTGLKIDDVDIRVATSETMVAFGEEIPTRVGYTYILDKVHGNVIQASPRKLSGKEQNFVLDIFRTIAKNSKVLADGKVDFNQFKLFYDNGVEVENIFTTLRYLIGFTDLNNVSADSKIRDKITSYNAGVRDLMNQLTETENTDDIEKLKKRIETGKQELIKLHNKYANNKSNMAIYFMKSTFNDPVAAQGGYIVVGTKEDGTPNAMPLFNVDARGKIIGDPQLNTATEEALKGFLENKYINVISALLQDKYKTDTFSMDSTIENGKIKLNDTPEYTEEQGGYRGFLLGETPSSGTKPETPLTVRIKPNLEDTTVMNEDGNSNYEGDKKELPTSVNRYLTYSSTNKKSKKSTTTTENMGDDNMDFESNKPVEPSEWEVEASEEGGNENYFSNTEFADDETKTENKEYTTYEEDGIPPPAKPAPSAEGDRIVFKEEETEETEETTEEPMEETEITADSIMAEFDENPEGTYKKHEEMFKSIEIDSIEVAKTFAKDDRNTFKTMVENQINCS